MPTADELVATDPPFLRLAETLEDPELSEHRLAMHLDNQFRLYREDMLGELREEIRIALGQKKGRHRGIVINGLEVLGVDCGTEIKRQSWGLRLSCKQDLPLFRGVKPKNRKSVVESSHNLLRHQSLTCLILDGAITAFPSIPQRRRSSCCKAASGQYQLHRCSKSKYSQDTAEAEDMSRNQAYPDRHSSIRL